MHYHNPLITKNTLKSNATKLKLTLLMLELNDPFSLLIRSHKTLVFNNAYGLLTN